MLKKVQEKQQAKEFGDAGTKFSILEIVDGKKIAWVENSGLSRRDLHDYKKVAEYIGEHIGEAYTIIESGSKVYIGEDLPGEYTQSEYTRRLFAKNRSVLLAKNKATDSIGDMIEIAENRRWEKTKHTHNKDAKYGMYRYDTCFAFPIKNNAGKVVDVKAYDAELLIRNASNGKKYLYDIVNIKENTDYQLELQQRKSRKGGAMLPTDRGVSSGTLTQNGESVKGKFSLDEAYRNAVSSGNVQEQQKLVEQAAKEAGYTKLFYHGSKKGGGFTTFKNWQYFTENKQYAQRYAGGENGLYTTYVKMENPFDTRQAEARSLFNEARQELGLSELQENGLPDWTDGYDLFEYMLVGGASVTINSERGNMVVVVRMIKNNRAHYGSNFTFNGNKKADTKIGSGTENRVGKRISSAYSNSMQQSGKSVNRNIFPRRRVSEDGNVQVQQNGKI